MGEGVPIYWRLGEKTATVQSLLRASETQTTGNNYAPSPDLSSTDGCRRINTGETGGSYAIDVTAGVRPFNPRTRPGLRSHQGHDGREQREIRKQNSDGGTRRDVIVPRLGVSCSQP